MELKLLLKLAKDRPDAKVAKYRRWAFSFKVGNAQRKKGALRQVVKDMPKARIQDVADTRVDVVWDQPVLLASALRIARSATGRDPIHFRLLGLPKGVKDDGKEKEDSREKKDKKGTNTVKDKKVTIKRREKEDEDMGTSREGCK